MTLIDDWHAYRKDAALFDPYHFEFLFNAHNTHTELELIFAGLPNADQAIERLRKLFEQTRHGGYDYQLPDPSKLIDLEQATTLTYRIRDETVTFLRSISEDGLADELQGLPVVEASTERLLAAANDTDNLQFGLGDAFSDTFLGQPYDPRHIHLGLFGAIRSLTKHTALASYILDPIWPFSQKFEADMQLYVGGYSHFACNNEILVVKL